MKRVESLGTRLGVPCLNRFSLLLMLLHCKLSKARDRDVMPSGLQLHFMAAWLSFCSLFNGLPSLLLFEVGDPDHYHFRPTADVEAPVQPLHAADWSRTQALQAGVSLRDLGERERERVLVSLPCMQADS